jgi:hypothetical protein
MAGEDAAIASTIKIGAGFVTGFEFTGENAFGIRDMLIL